MPAIFDLTDHHALVTGSSKGVGRAIAYSLAQAGADVVIHARELNDEAKSSIKRCKAHDVDAQFVAGDLAQSSEAVVDEVFAAALEANPDIDILINNAGAFFDVPFLEMTFDGFEKTIRLNVEAGYFLTQRFAKYWIERRVAGRVVFVGSINGELGEEHSTAYDISEGAIRMMVRTLTIALARHNIRVNGLAPGLVRSHATLWLDDKPEREKWLAAHTPNGLVPDSAVCGPGAVYLVSDEAEHVHGHMLMIDGGMGAWQHPDPPADASDVGL